MAKCLEKIADYSKKIQRIYSTEDMPFSRPMRKIYLYTKAEIQDALNERCDVLCETVECGDKIISRCYIEVNMSEIIKNARKR